MYKYIRFGVLSHYLLLSPQTNATVYIESSLPNPQINPQIPILRNVPSGRLWMWTNNLTHQCYARSTGQRTKEGLTIHSVQTAVGYPRPKPSGLLFGDVGPLKEMLDNLQICTRIRTRLKVDGAPQLHLPQGGSAHGFT